MRRLGDYELLRKIGSGGMAEVWMGRRAAMAGASKAVAIKLLARDLLDDPAYRDMFIEEARLSMLLSHSNVVQVFDVGEINEECFMVMEWVDGLNLSELTRKMLSDGQTLPVEVTAHVIGEVLRALAYAHSFNHDGAKATIVHRDVSPQNVLVSVSGEVKLADFGVARLAREETSGLHVKGKLRYMAPEQLRGRSREPTVDIYAVGAIMHELLEGKRFRSTRDEGDLYSMVLSGEHPPLTVDVPPELEHLRKRLLEPDPKRRMQSVDEALELLYAWPGYRNSALELGKLIRRWIGVGGPRSGIVSTGMLQAGEDGLGPSTASVAQTVPADTRQAGRAGTPGGSQPHEAVTAVESAQESGPNQDRGATQTRTFIGSSDHEGAPTSLISSEPRQPGFAGPMLIVAVMTLALSFGVFGLGFPLGWWGGGERGSEVAGDDADTESQLAIAPQPDLPTDVADSIGETGLGETGLGETGLGETGPEEAEDTGAEDTGAEDTGAEDTGAEDTGAEDTGAADTDGGDGDGDPPPPPPPPPKKVEPVEVEFLANGNGGGFVFVYVRVDGQHELTLEPLKVLEIKPGKHHVEFRQDEADSWTKAGTIKIEPGKNYRVRMLKPAGLKLESR